MQTIRGLHDAEGYIPLLFLEHIIKRDRFQKLFLFENKTVAPKVNLICLLANFRVSLDLKDEAETQEFSTLHAHKSPCTFRSAKTTFQRAIHPFNMNRA